MGSELCYRIRKHGRNILEAHFLPLLSQCVWQQVTGLNRICIPDWQERERDSRREDGRKIVIEEERKRLR